MEKRRATAHSTHSSALSQGRFRRSVKYSLWTGKVRSHPFHNGGLPGDRIFDGNPAFRPGNFMPPGGASQLESVTHQAGGKGKTAWTCHEDVGRGHLVKRPDWIPVQKKTRLSKAPQGFQAVRVSLAVYFHGEPPIPKSFDRRAKNCLKP